MRSKFHVFRYEENDKKINCFKMVEAALKLKT